MTGSACPPWCVKPNCEGLHEGEVITAATGMSLTASRDVPLLVTPLHEEAEGLEPELYITDQWDGSDWGMQLSTREARRLGRTLLATADLIDPDTAD